MRRKGALPVPLPFSGSPSVYVMSRGTLSRHVTVWLRGDEVLEIENAIEFEDVTFSYETGTRALDGVSLRIAAGEFVVVLGANGSGKSTLARHVDALVLPDEGRVRVCGIDTADRARIFDLRRRVGMVFQSPESQMVAPTVFDDVAFGPENIGLDASEVASRVAGALDAVQLSAHAHDEVSCLSGGEQQRVALAGALALHPEVLVLDEPGAMLDPEGRRLVLALAHQLNAEGMTVVLVTHFVEDALGADRVIVLDAGRVVREGAPQAVLVRARGLRALGLEPPFALELSEALRARGLEVGEHIDDSALEEELCRLLSRM